MSGGFNKAGPDSASHQRQMSQYNQSQIMQQMQNTEDVYMSIIQELQFDRCKLRAKDMT